jgi:serine/threonine protein kinase
MDSSLSKPTRIGAYDIVNVIGRGGMGTVFKGTDPRIGRSVAIKVLTAAADDPDLLLRFYREAKYTGSLQHQNIVTVYELGHQDGIPYLVMEYLEGVSLDAVIASGRPMPIAEKLRIVLQVCNGLAYAHKRDLVHRDIKPANIVILENGTAKIVDFGIARLAGNKLTRTGHVVGSLNYMSPEQLNGDVDVDLRTDVYSTGVVLFQLLTGVLPFEGGTTAGTLRKIIQDPPPQLKQYLKDCPPELEVLTQRALAKNREERYSSAEDFGIEVARLHQQYERQMLADYLQQAADSLKKKDYGTARQQVLQVLRVAPQNTEGVDLLRLIKQGQEEQQREQQQRQREQQAVQLQMKAEEAFRKKDFKEALQFIEQGLQIESSRAIFLSLRDAIFEAQANVAKYRDALQRADTALRAGDLETAKRSIDSAIEILPDEPGCRALAAQIAARIEQQLREQKGAQKQRQLAVAMNTVEKAMADARMLVFLGRAPEALEALNKVENVVPQIPPHWREQVQALRKEAQAKREREQGPADPVDWREMRGGETAQMPAPPNATVVMQPDLAPAVEPRFETPAEPWSATPEHSDREIVEYPAGEPYLSVRGSRTYSDREYGKPEVAPELLEFLQPEPSHWSRPMIWLGVAVMVMFAAMVWLIIRPKPESARRTPPPAGGTVATSTYTYAEINAEPWGRVRGIEPASAESAKVVGLETPLRVKLPPGEYSITLEGPNRDQKRVDITVPQQGGTSCFVVFQKPDLNRILSGK